jgi:hypothetical protein
VPVERRYVLFTDDEAEAQGELSSRRAASTLDHQGYRGWDIGEVALMEDPPETDKKYCVFQIKENK